MRMRVLTFLAAAILGASASLLVACGDRSDLIPSSDASELRSALDQVAAATSAGDCSTAQRAVTRASSVLAGLPDGVDARLRARLRTGIANLRARVPVQCIEQTDTTPAETQSTPAATTPTQTQTTPTETTTTPTQTQTQTQTTPTHDDHDHDHDHDADADADDAIDHARRWQRHRRQWGGTGGASPGATGDDGGPDPRRALRARRPARGRGHVDGARSPSTGASSATSRSSSWPSTWPTTATSSPASAARRWPRRGSCTRTSSRSSTSGSTTRPTASTS